MNRFFGRLTFWKIVMWVVFAAGMYSVVYRYARGLGAATNLSDSFPWGLWIGFDLLVGVGLAAGGFVIAATVHVFRIEKYEEIARPTILTAFLGYILVIVALLIDLGKPWNIWHPIIMWNPQSVMFEVAWCVMLYTTVLALEFSPLVFERFGLKKPLKLIQAIYTPLVIVGVLLSTLHQSSLGTLYVIVPDKLHGLWYTPWLPVFFFASAVAAGLAMTIFESYMSSRAFGRGLEKDLLMGLGRVIVVVLGVYALARLQDLATRGNLGLAFQMTPEAMLFWGEAGLGVILPMILFATPAIRRDEHGLFFAAVLTVLGFILNRLNVAITGMAASSGVSYFPSFFELMVTASIVTAGFVAFALAVKYLPVFPEEDLAAAHGAARAAAMRAEPTFGKRVLLGLWSLLLVGAVVVGFSLGRDGKVLAAVDETTEAPPPIPAAWSGDLTLPEEYTFPLGEDSLGPVAFRHETHVDPSSPDCASCHATQFSLIEPGRPITGSITYERVHEGDLCFSCHDGEKAFAVTDDCSICHQ
jgi:c(7)-type cytochrome triheme protein